MSDLLHPVRLYWNGLTGFARCDGIQASLKHPPRVKGIGPVFEIDFSPGSICELRETSNAAKREMRGDEIEAAIKHLYALATAARDILDKETTLVTVVLRP